jgi:hypothetical protein
MAQEGSDTDDLQSDPAAEAFDALRSDLLARLNGLAGELKGPDYSPTLGAIVKTLQAIERHRGSPRRFGWRATSCASRPSGSFMAPRSK